MKKRRCKSSVSGIRKVPLGDGERESMQLKLESCPGIRGTLHLTTTGYESTLVIDPKWGGQGNLWERLGLN